MTFSESRAWLDGFKEAISEAPTPDQWAKVLAKLDTVQPEYRPNIGELIGPYLRPAPTIDLPFQPFGPVWCGPNPSTTSGSITAPYDPNIRLNN